MADFTLDGIVENSDLLDLPWPGFAWNEDGDQGENWLMGGGSDHLLLENYPIATDDPEINRSYVHESEEERHRDSRPDPVRQAGTLRPRKRRVLFREHCHDDSSVISTTSSESSAKLQLDFPHSISDEITWPLVGSDSTNCDSIISDAELSEWLTDIFPDLNDKLTATGTNDPSITDLPPADIDDPITNKSLDQPNEPLAPKTPDPVLGKTSGSMTEPGVVDVRRLSSTPPTPCGENTSVPSNMVCQPFSILRPEGSLSVQNINDSLRKPSARLSSQVGHVHCSEAEKAHGLIAPPIRDLSVALSGKPIVNRVKIIMEGEGTLTITRTAN